jgi:hypothetical protein
MANAKKGRGDRRQRLSKARMCGTKVQLSEEGAKQAVDRRVAAGAFRESINAYPCHHCGHWHTGTRNQETVAGRRRR